MNSASSSPTRNLCSGRLPAPTSRMVGVFAGFEDDIVVEPFRLLVGVSVASDIDEQRGVVDGGPVRPGQCRLVSQPQRDQALAQDVFHRLAEAQVHAE